MATIVRPDPNGTLVTPAPNCTVKLYLMHPGEAATWVQKGLFERQRPLRRYHVDFLKHLMLTGKFRQASPIDFAVLDRQQLVVNGQHTLHAIVAAQKPQWVTLTMHRLQTLDEVAHLYNTFDRQLPRNARDLLAAYGFVEATKLAARHSLLLLGSMRLVLSGLCYPMPVSDARLGYLRDQELLYVAAMDWAKEAGVFFAAIKGMSSTWGRYILRQPLAAVAIVQARYKPVQAAEFWTLVAHESHANPHHPTRLLAKWIHREGIRGNYNRIDYVRMTAAAWDAFYHQRPIRQLNMQDAGRPINLAGTPHTSSSVRRYVTPEWDLLREPVPYAEPMYERG